MARWPVTLWLYVLGDFWKLVLLTTSVLVVVLAFALTIKPLADGKLDLMMAMQWMGLATIPMLQYALPFAACFAATLSYHRMAVDNELTASYAGGISHRAILAPAVVSGVVISLVLLFLSNWAIPRSFQAMYALVTRDASRFMVSAIMRHEAVELEKSLVYADTVVEQGPDEASGAYQRLWLGGLLVVKLDGEGRVTSQGTAKNAAVWLRRATRAQGGGADDQAVTEVIVKPNDFIATGEAMHMAGQDTELTFIVPNTLSDNPKFLSFAELRALRRAPERMNFIERPRRELAMLLSAREAADIVRQHLHDTGQCEFRDPFNQRVVLKGSGLRPASRDGKRDPFSFSIMPPAGASQIIVERTSIEGRLQRQSAVSAFLKLPSNPDTTGQGVRLTLRLCEVAAEQVDAEGDVEVPPEVVAAGRGELKERPLTDLTLTDDRTKDYLKTTTFRLQDMVGKRIAMGRPADKDALAKPSDELDSKVKDLLREVLSKEQERYAMSVACLVMVIVGAVMAMRLRDALPLTIYLWAFFPALATSLAISGGQQLTHGQGVIGLPVLWSGVFVLSVFTVLEFGRLAKH